MKTVKEIKDFKDRYRHMAINTQNTQDLNQFIFDALIGITEHLEADPIRVKMPLEDAIDLPTYTEQVRRKGMIEAMRWGLSRSANERLNAIDRLENGGDL